MHLVGFVFWIAVQNSNLILGGIGNRGQQGHSNFDSPGNILVEAPVYEGCIVLEENLVPIDCDALVV